MAEARSAVRELRVPPTLEEGRDSWKDLYIAIRKSVARRYYRTRNSIRNGTWPTSTNNLIGVFVITLSLLLGDPESTRSFNQWLWSISHILFLPRGTPKWIQALIISWIVGIVFFFIVMKVRQYILRMLLSYRGWLYEALKSQSIKTVFWAILVRMVSGYNPSLYSCQRSLPRLPVPSLQSTLDKLLDSLVPLCSKSELEELKLEAENFKNGIGAKLQKILILKSWWSQNYVTDWWEKYVYLMSRTSLPINSNYYGMDSSYWTPIKRRNVRAATVLYHVLNFKRQIEREELAPLVLRNTIPICMAQYERLFSTVRIPGEEIDELIHYDSSESRHIIVLFKGVYFKLEVFDSKNQILSPSSILAQLELIEANVDEFLKTDQSNEFVYCISALTTLPRTDWAVIRKSELLSNTTNRVSLQEIEKSILILVLSEESPETLNERARFLIHADGKTFWFDKSVNMVFFKNGRCGINVEHSLADAPALGHCWEYAMTKEIIEKWYTEEGMCMPMHKNFRQGKHKAPVRLGWEIKTKLADNISNALNNAKKNNDDLDLYVYDHDSWGKGLIKKCRTSPDAFVQLALQLAYFKDSGSFAQTYEASMTRLYLNGRTETVRSCTKEAVNFVKAMIEDNKSREEKIKLFSIAAEKHQQLYRDSMNGKGIDRHLFALYVACRGLEYKSPFLEKVLMRPWTLSTSQQPQQQLSEVPDVNLPIFQDKVSPGGGFGPVSDEGYGVSYMLPSDHKIFFHIASKHSCPKTSSTRFVENLGWAMDEIRQLFQLNIKTNS